MHNEFRFNLVVLYVAVTDEGRKTVPGKAGVISVDFVIEIVLLEAMLIARVEGNPLPGRYAEPNAIVLQIARGIRVPQKIT